MRYLFGCVDFVLFDQVQVHEGADQDFGAVFAGFYVQRRAVDELKQQPVVYVCFLCALLEVFGGLGGEEWVDLGALIFTNVAIPLQHKSIRPPE